MIQSLNSNILNIFLSFSFLIIKTGFSSVHTGYIKAFKYI